MAKKGKTRGKSQAQTRTLAKRKRLRFSLPVRTPVSRSSLKRKDWRTDASLRQSVVKKRRKRVLIVSTTPTASKSQLKSDVLTSAETLRKKVCRRRQQRKQIIHAVNRSGRGGQKQPDQHWRDIKC